MGDIYRPLIFSRVPIYTDAAEKLQFGTSPPNNRLLRAIPPLCYTACSPMSYTVLARRYRSATFDEVVGQEAIAQTLKKAIATDRLAHAYLFCGTRGTGKTSMARILAKALNCLSAKKPTPEPCLTCDSCTAIARGDDIDVIEIDAASHTGVDNVREIIENSQYRPARSRFKVYIIDEVHMLSKSAFNALLKTLEEPPEHVKFILATTEPEKVLPTILSRCQRYDFRNIAAREIAGHLKEICKKEKIAADEDALGLIARAGNGSMRDALSLLDRLLSLGEKHLTAEMIEQMLGLPRAQRVAELVNAIGSADVKSALSQADAMIRSGLSADVLIGSLADHLRNLLIVRTCGPDSELLDFAGTAPAEFAAQAQKFDPATLAQDIAILEELRRNLRHSQTGRAMLDATLVRLALAEQFASIGQLLSGEAGIEDIKKKPAPAVSKVQPPAVTVQLPKPPARRPVEASQQKEKPDFSRDIPAAVNAANVSEPSVETIGDDDIVKIWPRLIDMLGTRSSAMKSVLSQATLSELRDGQAVIRFRHEQETFARQWSTNGRREMIAEALTTLRGQSVGVRFEVDPDPVQSQPQPVLAATAPAVSKKPPLETADAEIAESSPARPVAEIAEDLKSDPVVQLVLREFGGTLVVPRHERT
jgi:DNA polymerase III subunit gamma/tau